MKLKYKWKTGEREEESEIKQSRNISVKKWNKW